MKKSKKCLKDGYLFLDMEWNQIQNHPDSDECEAVRIGILMCNEKFENVMIFSRTIRPRNIEIISDHTYSITRTSRQVLERSESETDILIKLVKNFKSYRYIVVWNRSSYDIFIRDIKAAGLRLPPHKLIILQDIIRITATGKCTSFESALKYGEIPFMKHRLHNSRYDVKYLYQLFKKASDEFTLNTRNDNKCIASLNSNILHMPDCKYACRINKGIYAHKVLIFKGYRPCSCCGSTKVWKRLFWNPITKEEKKEKFRTNMRNLALTDENIAFICQYFDLDYNIGMGVVFVKSLFSTWRIFYNENGITGVYHENYRPTIQNIKKHFKFNEGYHLQEINASNFYDVISYIFHHDKNFVKNLKQ